MPRYQFEDDEGVLEESGEKDGMSESEEDLSEQSDDEGGSHDWARHVRDDGRGQIGSLRKSSDRGVGGPVSHPTNRKDYKKKKSDGEKKTEKETKDDKKHEQEDRSVSTSKQSKGSDK
ncbi:hypothetical protein OE88DRAFT_1810590 [Heliocybe sulcata]|uniref:Uncharacterized protein n=1 Tax=Heliocybe sulcata TaxID=5364 RepID=A0A5C3MVT7_9AGAM|nr:hypothetical protein OE88DRAFT_1810590 [Heliocybe sulcata]